MTQVEPNKAIARRFIERIFVARDGTAVDELLTDDFTPHTWGQTGPGKAAVVGAIERTSAGLSDVAMRIEDVIAEGDRVVVRLTASAVQSGEFMGMPASGKRYEIGEIHIFRIRDGKVSEHWHQADLLGMQRQLSGEAAG
jgi:steroid delta-isomerase-like uncharacterized protein